MHNLQSIVKLLKQKGFIIVDFMCAEDGAQIVLQHKGYKAYSAVLATLEHYVVHRTRGYAMVACAHVGCTVYTQFNSTIATVYLLNSAFRAFPAAPLHKLP